MQSGRTTLSQIVTEELLDRIRSGVYPPRSRLATEKILMEEFDVGRNVIREAIHSLVSMGYIDVRPGRGAVVIGIESEHAIDAAMFSALLSDSAVDDINDFRRVIEVEIAVKAAQHATADDLRAMQEHLDEFARRSEDGLSVTEPELAFHAAIAAASGNQIYPRVLELLRDNLAAARALTGHIESAVQIAITDHQAILEAIAAGDSELARELMSRHMDHAVEAIEIARRIRADSVPEPSVEV